METSSQCKCEMCNKEYKNINLHMIKKHNLFKCCSCQKYKNADNAIYDIGDKKKGKYCNSAMCDKCWT